MPPKNKKKTAASKFPMVSVCTPTFNRRPFIPFMFECFKHQDYPMSRIEWIIVDDGTDKIKDLVDEANIPQIKYFPVEEKMMLGKKRNFMHEKCSGSIIVYMDDDDYYPPERISHAVETLKQNPDAMCAGSSILYMYFNHIHKMYQFGPYGPNHATAGTFAFRKGLLETSRYEDNAALAEEKHFLKDYTVPFVQLDPEKTILVFSHIHNTFNKRNLIENMTAETAKFVKETKRRVCDFVKNDVLRNFITNKIDALLVKYDPGHPKHKPEAHKQLIELIEKQQEIKRKHQEEHGPIIMEVNGKDPQTLTNNQVREILTSQINQIKELHKMITEMRTDNDNKKVELDATKLVAETRDKRIEELEEELSVFRMKNISLSTANIDPVD